MELQIKDKVKFRSVSENLVKIGLIKNITHKLNNPNNKYEILADDGELYLNVHEDDIISFLGFGPSYMADVCENKEELNYDAGDCIYIKNGSTEGYMIACNDKDSDDSKIDIHLVDLLGRLHSFPTEYTDIISNNGPIWIPGVGNSNNHIPLPLNKFKFKKDTMVIDKLTKQKAKIIDAYFNPELSSVFYNVEVDSDGFCVTYTRKYDELEDLELHEYMEEEAANDVKSNKEVTFKRGDCIFFINESTDISSAIIIDNYNDGTIRIRDFLGRYHIIDSLTDSSETSILRNYGNITIPGFGEVNEKRIPNFDDFKYHYGDIVTYEYGDTGKHVGKITNACYIKDQYAIQYLITALDDNTYDAWKYYNEIEPGDYRMKEQEQKVKSEINCTLEWDEESGCSVHGRCDKCPATDILNQDSLSGFRSHDEICAIKFHKPLVSIFYNNGGESTVELSMKNAYNTCNKKVGFLLAYIQGLLSTEEYDTVINVIQSINKEPQQIIKFDETYNEDD